MPRKIVITSGISPSILVETKAENELELQEMIKNNPDLLPIEEFGMTGPLLVVGRETTLPSGGVDLVAIAKSGEILIVEFKTGPENTDFRRVLAQLLDYGSDMWSLTFEEFESVVALRYFAGQYCQDARVKGSKSLEDAAKAIWSDLGEEEFNSIKDRLSQQLSSGRFSYVVVAQRFTDSVLRTAEYLNEVLVGARAYAVEVVRFRGEDHVAFETRTVLRPPTKSTGSASSLDENKFLEVVSDGTYREFLSEFFETCRSLSFRFEWGTSGVSIRLSTEDRPEPLTIAWVFEPGRSGWMGLVDLNFGYDPWSAEQTPSIRGALNTYVATIEALEGNKPAKAKNFSDSVRCLSPGDAITHKNAITEALATLSNARNSPEV